MSDPTNATAILTEAVQTAISQIGDIVVNGSENYRKDINAVGWDLDRALQAAKDAPTQEGA